MQISIAEIGDNPTASKWQMRSGVRGGLVNRKWESVEGICIMLQAQLEGDVIIVGSEGESSALNT